MNTVLADGTNKALCQDTVQGGDKVVCFDAHIQEASDDVDNVVGVNRGENQVSCQSRLDGDLSGLRVTDLTDQDLIRIVAQNRTQSASKGEALLFIDGNL